jgi:hypothetical protein
VKLVVPSLLKSHRESLELLQLDITYGRHGYTKESIPSLQEFEVLRSANLDYTHLIARPEIKRNRHSGRFVEVGSILPSSLEHLKLSGRPIDEHILHLFTGISEFIEKKAQTNPNLRALCFGDYYYMPWLRDESRDLRQKLQLVCKDSNIAYSEKQYGLAAMPWSPTSDFVESDNQTEGGIAHTWASSACEVCPTPMPVLGVGVDYEAEECRWGFSYSPFRILHPTPVTISCGW